MADSFWLSPVLTKGVKDQLATTQDERSKARAFHGGQKVKGHFPSPQGDEINIINQYLSLFFFSLSLSLLSPLAAGVKGNSQLGAPSCASLKNMGIPALLSSFLSTT